MDKPIPAFVIAYSDSSFSNPHSVVFTETPQFDPEAFTFVGKEMDGLESKRHGPVRVVSNGAQPKIEYDPQFFNWFEIGLKQRSEVEKIEISTKWFTGNQVRSASVILKDELTGKETTVLERVTLKPDFVHDFPIPKTIATECRILCYCDGGTTRFHLYGKSVEQLPQRQNLLETATISHVSNEHYGKPVQAVNGNREVGHMLGWESARTGFGEQGVFQLKAPATIDEIVVDTYMHVYNSPLSCHVFALNNESGKSTDELVKSAPKWKIRFANGREVIPDDIRTFMMEEKFRGEAGGSEKFSVELHIPQGTEWKTLLPFAPLMRDTYHRFTHLESIGPVTHILFMYFPNGGIHGLKVFGK